MGPSTRSNFPSKELPPGPPPSSPSCLSPQQSPRHLFHWGPDLHFCCLSSLVSLFLCFHGVHSHFCSLLSLWIINASLFLPVSLPRVWMDPRGVHQSLCISFWTLFLVLGYRIPCLHTLYLLMRLFPIPRPLQWRLTQEFLGCVWFQDLPYLTFCASPSPFQTNRQKGLLPSPSCLAL